MLNLWKCAEERKISKEKWGENEDILEISENASRIKLN